MTPDLKNVVELLSNVTEAFTAAVFLYDESRQELSPAAYHTLSKNFDSQVRIAPGDGIVGYVAKSGQALNISNFDRETGSTGFYLTEEGIKSFLAVPLGQEGVVCVDSKQTYTFTDKDQKILEGFAGVILQILTAAGVERREKDYARMLSLLHEINRAATTSDRAEGFVLKALGEMRRFAAMEVAFLTLPDKHHRRYRVEVIEGPAGPNFAGTSYPLESGLVGWVYRERQPLKLRWVRGQERKSYVFSPEDPIKKFQSFLGLPLEIWGDNVGVLGLVGLETRDWSADQVAVLAMIGRWIASALKARLVQGGV